MLLSSSNPFDAATWRRLALNGATLEQESSNWRFVVNPLENGYTNAQIDDYGGTQRRRFRHLPGTSLTLHARFSDSAENLRGTAGFGFWNAPFADPTVTRPALPQAVWFFCASPPNYLPFARHGPALGWFVGTVDARRPRALAIAPLTLPVLLLNQIPPLRRHIWPWVQSHLSISHAPLSCAMEDWHDYRLDWRPNGCAFFVDDALVFQTPYTPRGPLGFVCWIDNQYMVLTPRGRIGYGVVPLVTQQWLEIRDLQFRTLQEF